MAKLLKLRRGSTSGHNSFTGAEGEVTIDITKDTAVVHDGSTAGGRPLAREDMNNVSSASIAGRLADDAIAPSRISAGALDTDVTVTNANVVANAAIAGTKVSPDFGSQNVATTGTLGSGDITISDNSPKLTFTDGDQDPDYAILVDGGSFAIQRAGSNNIRIQQDGTVDVTGNLNVSAGVDVTGNITVTGTVDGVDVAALNTAVSGLSSGSGALTNGVTATTQSASDNSTKVATTAYTDTAISNLVDSSPTALNTLNELAAALGDDANFSTTVTNNIATKFSNAGGSTITGDFSIFSGTTNKSIDVDVSDKVKFDDLLKATFGDSDDLQIYHSGTNNVIDSTNAWLNITSDGGVAIRHEVQADGSDGENMALFKPDGAVELYHDDSKKFETTTAGVTVTGALTATGDVTAFSDKILKKDITTINDALSLCGKLRGVSYKWVTNDEPSIGVIAQEIEQYIPEIVTVTQLNGKDVRSVDYGKIVGVLINAINELKAEFEAHKAECAKQHGGE